jgi:ribonuclease HI
MYPCYFCSFGDDANHGDKSNHIFSGCAVTRGAVLDALLSVEGPGDQLFTKLYRKKSTPLFILDFPTADSGSDYSRLVFICCALWAIWSSLSEIKKGRSADGAQRRISTKILSMKKIWTATKSGTTSRYGNATNRSVQQTLACKLDADKLVNSFPHNSILIFTDGSARGNPGPAGAGAFISTPGIEDTKILFPLGHSTNNVGELWAIGMALEFIAKDHNFREFVDTRPIYILSDSLFARNAIGKGTAKQESLSLLVSRIRTLISRYKAYAPKIYWVPGHSGINGNVIADSLATEASSLSESMYANGLLSDHLEFFSLFCWTTTP